MTTLKMRIETDEYIFEEYLEDTTDSTTPSPCYTAWSQSMLALQADTTNPMEGTQ